MSTVTNSEEVTLIRQWQRNIRLNQIAHLRTSASCSSTGRLLGLLVTIFSVVVGTSIFASLNSSDSRAILIIVGIVSVAATVLSAIHSFLNYGERTERHQSAGIKYGVLRRRIDEDLVTITKEDQLEKEINEIRKELDKLEQEAPVVPQKYIDKARALITLNQDKYAGSIPESSDLQKPSR